QDGNGSIDIRPILNGIGSIVYSPDSGWLLAGDIKVLSFIGLKFLFADPSLYALQIEVQPFGKLEIQYRRINDAVGLYYVDVPPPIQEFSLEAVNLILGN